MKLLPIVCLGVLMLATMTAEEPLRVVTDDNYPPYCFTDENGVLKGILVDQWKAWSEVSGREVKLTGMDWAKAIQAFETGDADVIDTLFYTPERGQKYHFSAPYADIEVPVFIHQSISGISSIQDLKGFRIAVKSGDACIEFLRSEGVTDFLYFDNYETIIQKAKDMEIRVFCIDKPPALYFLYKAGIDTEYRYTLNLNTGQFHRAVLKGNEALMVEIETGFAQIPLRRLKAIQNAWFGTTIAPPINLRFVALIGIIAGGVLVILLSFVFILRRQVALKTSELEQHVSRLVESERRNAALIAALPDLYFIIDRDGTYLDCSRNNRHLLARDWEQLVGKKITEIDLHPELQQRFMETISAVLRDGRLRILRYDLAVPAGLCHFEARVVKFDEKSVLYLSRDISEQSRYEQSLLASLNEKEILLKEVHHRVKNNLQIISSLVALQGDLFKDETDRKMMQETQARIQSMAQLHELLYQSKDFMSINMNEYFNLIFDELAMSYHGTRPEITVVRNIQDVNFNLQIALPVGLIVNELVSNVFKYAFTEQESGVVHIDFIKNDGQGYLLRVQDNGVGLGADFDVDKAMSLGFVLVKALTQQLAGTLTIDGTKGTRVEVCFNC